MEWYNEIPSTEWARGVPLAERGTGEFVGIGVSETKLMRPPTARRVPAADTVIDLADPQGFAFAFRLIMRSGSSEAQIAENPGSATHERMRLLTFDGMLTRADARYPSGQRVSRTRLVRALTGQEDPTDADRLALARCLAEIVRDRNIPEGFVRLPCGTLRLAERPAWSHHR